MSRPPAVATMSTDEMAAACRAGATLAEVAAMAGVSLSAVRERFLRAGVQRRLPGPRGPNTGARNAEWLRRVEAGEQAARIAAEVGVSRQAVHVAIHRARRRDAEAR